VTALPRCSDVDLLGDGKCIVNLDAELPDGALHFGVPKEKLNRAEVPGSPIIRVALVRRNEWVPNNGESRPMLAIHPDNRRAYWRVERQRPLPRRLRNRNRGALSAHRKVLVDRLARLVGDLAPDRKTGFVLSNGRAVDGIAMRGDVLDFEAHHLAAAWLPAGWFDGA
jgi:hypothetical protein